MKSGCWLVLGAVVLAAGVCTGQAAENPARASTLAEVAPEVVATVNGKDLSRDQLGALMFSLYGRQTLETLITQEAVRQEAERQGVTVTPEEVEAFGRARVQEQLDEQARRMGAKDLSDLVARSKSSAAQVEALRRNAEEALRPFVAPELLARKLMAREVTVSDADLRAEFDRQHGPKVKFLQIVTRTKPEAEEIVKKLALGADFAALARELSQDRVSARKGGEMDPLSRGTLLGDAAFALKPGQVSAPVQSPDGFHVVKLVEVLPAAGTAFDEVKEALRADLVDRTMRAQREEWLDKLLLRTEVRRRM